MAYSQISYRERVIEHAAKLGVKVTLTGKGIGCRERVQVRCEHREDEVSALAFCRKFYCCRNEARRHQSNRENVGAINAKKLRGVKHTIDRRIKSGDSNRKRGALKAQDDLLYVATREGKIKVGRVALYHRAWFKKLGLTILHGWELESWAAFKLENEIHDRFGDQRTLDPLFGKGWTEVFDTDPKNIINFIEERLQL